MHESSSPSIAESHLFRVIRNISIVHSALLLIFSSSLVGYGSWILVWATDLKIFDVILNYYYFSYAPPLMVACGLLCFILVAVGCCAACVDDVHLLLSTIILDLVGCVLLLSVGVCALLANKNLYSGLDDAMVVAVTKYYGINQDIQRNLELTRAIDNLQLQLGCCGVQGERNSSVSWFLYRHSSTWYRVHHRLDFGPPFVPDSCCVTKGQMGGILRREAARANFDELVNRNVCVGLSPVPSASGPVFTAPTASRPRLITQDNIYLNQQGCLTVASERFSRYTSALIGLGFAGGVYLAIGVIMGFVMLYELETRQVNKSAGLCGTASSVGSSKTFDSRATGDDSFPGTKDYPLSYRI
ncbi:cd63 antigen [Sparganum proliferum]